MSLIKIGKVTNANVYINGNSLLGTIDELTLPDITMKKADHKALGMPFEISIVSGFEKMEGKVKVNSFYPDIIALAADPYTTQLLQTFCSVESWTTAGRIVQKQGVISMSVNFTKMPGGMFKQSENVELEYDFSVFSYKLEIDGVEIIFADAMASIYRVMGADKLGLFRANQGS